MTNLFGRVNTQPLRVSDDDSRTAKHGHKKKKQEDLLEICERPKEETEKNFALLFDDMDERTFFFFIDGATCCVTIQTAGYY